MEPFVSILIPVYNGLEFLNDCLKSVQAQTFQSWEVLIGLNGHGSGGEASSLILDILAERSDPRMKLIVQESIQGKVESLNHLLKDAKGQWIALLDCDDLWLPNKLETQIHALRGDAKGADILGTGCTYFGELQHSPQIPTGWITSSHLRAGNPIINSSSLIRRDVCEELQWRYTDLCYGMEDYDFWMRAERRGYKLWNHPASLVLHRIHRASAFNTKKQDPRPLQEAYAKLLGL